MYLIMLSVKQGGIMYHNVFGMTQPKIETIGEYSTHQANNNSGIKFVVLVLWLIFLVMK